MSYCQQCADKDKEIASLKKVVPAALDSVNNPLWCGICDEDVALESALRDYIKEENETRIRK